MLKREDMVFVCLGLDFMQDFPICFSLHGKIVERVKVFFKLFFQYRLHNYNQVFFKHSCLKFFVHILSNHGDVMYSSLFIAVTVLCKDMQVCHTVTCRSFSVNGIVGDSSLLRFHCQQKYGP